MGSDDATYGVLIIILDLCGGKKDVWVVYDVKLFILFIEPACSGP